MKHITGIGGIFFKANDPEKLGEWYRKHLGLEVEEFGGVTFRENEVSVGGPKQQAYTVWSPFAADTDYFAPSEKPFMINFRVVDLDSLLAQLRREGVRVDERTEKSEFGYFGWVMGSGRKPHRIVGATGNPNCFAIDSARLSGGQNFWVSFII